MSVRPFVLKPCSFNKFLCFMMAHHFSFDFIERRLSNWFCLYAKFVSKWPIPFIIVPIVISLSMSFGFVYYLDVLKDDISLYTPTDGRAKNELAILKTNFPVNDSDLYFVERRFDIGRRSGYIIASSKSDTNVLTDNVFSEIFRFWKNVVEKIEVRENDKIYTYKDICVLMPVDKGRMCVKNPLFLLYNDGSNKSLPSLTFPSYENVIPGFIPKPIEIFIGNSIGGVILDNVNQMILNATALLLPYQLKYSTESMDLLAEKWERQLDKVLLNGDYVTDKITIDWWTSETLNMETSRDTGTLMKLLAPMCLIVTAFTVACCFVNDAVRSKPWLGLAGILSAGLAIVSSIGLLMMAGVKLTSVSYFVPFLTLAIGVDNIFILIAAWRKTSIYDTVTDRMVGTFRDAAVSITVTSLTDAVSFAVGCMSNFPSVKNFCLYSCVAILFVYINQLTFFAGCMILSGIREKQNRHCLTLRLRTTVKEQNDVSKSGGLKDGISDHVAARFFRGPYADILLHPWTKCMVFLVLFVYAAVAAWAAANMTIGVHPVDLLPAGSRYRTTLKLYDTHFDVYADFLHVIFTNVSRSEYTPEFWLTFGKEIERFENTTFTYNAESWYKTYLAFLQSMDYLSTNGDDFVPVLHNIFLPKFPKYLHDIVFQDERTLKACRFMVRLKHVPYSRHKEFADYFRRLADESTSNFGVQVYHDSFQFADQFDAILPSILSNVAAGSLAVVIVSLLLIPKPLCSIWVCATIASINLGIFGYMSLWGVHLDFVSMVTIVMSIGASVDFSAHIAYHFAKSQQEMSPEERIRDSLYVVGAPIVQSACSTLLGVVLIVVVDSYTFRSFVKTTFLIILLGALHGLVVLPVLLTVFYCRKRHCSVTGCAASSDGSKKVAATTEMSSMKNDDWRKVAPSTTINAKFVTGKPKWISSKVWAVKNIFHRQQVFINDNNNVG